MPPKQLEQAEEEEEDDMLHVGTFRTTDEFDEDGDWDDPTTMVPKHLLLFTTSMPELPKWNRPRVRSPSPPPRPLLRPGSGAAPGAVGQEKKTGRIRPQSAQYGPHVEQPELRNIQMRPLSTLPRAAMNPVTGMCVS